MIHNKSKKPWAKIIQGKRRNLLEKTRNPNVVRIIDFIIKKNLRGNEQFEREIYIPKEELERRYGKEEIQEMERVNQVKIKTIKGKKEVNTGTIKVERLNDKEAKIIFMYPFIKITSSQLKEKKIQNEGVGAKVLYDTMSKLKQKGIEEFYVESNEESVDFYKKMGFVPLLSKNGITLLKKK